MTTPAAAPAADPAAAPAAAPAAPAPAATIIGAPPAAPAAPAPGAAAAGAPGAPAAPAAPAAADPAKGFWPDDWRQRLAAEDKADMKTLERLGSPDDLWKQNKSLRQKLSSGEYVRKLAPDATPEQIREWRTENQLPENAEGYLAGLKLPNGMVLGEADKPIAQSFAENLGVKKNWSQDQVNDAVTWYYEEQDRQAAAREEADGSFKQQSEDALRSEWGNDYRRNVTAVNNMFAGWPKGLAASLLAARDENGRKLGDNPAFVKQLFSIANDLDPAATLVPANAGQSGQAVETRMAELKKMMGDRKSAYWKGPQSAALQEEYRKLVDASARMKARVA